MSNSAIPITTIKSYAIGIGVAFILALISLKISQFSVLKNNGFGLLTVSVLLGMIIGNLLTQRQHRVMNAGLSFSKQRLLRIGVALYGLRLSFSAVMSVGLGAFVVDVLIMLSTIVIAMWFGVRVLKMDRTLTALVGSGHAVCGAAAVMACSGVMKAKDSDIAVSVACVVIYGTLAILLYPWIYQLNLALFSSDHAFGVFTGATVHEVAQVVAIGTSLPFETAQAALISKLIRVLLLAPFMLILAWYLARQSKQQERLKVPLPIFVFGFIACMLFNTWLPLSETQAYWAYLVDDLMLATAMAALGLGTRFSELKQAGVKPLILAAVLTTQLVVVGGALSLVIL